MCMKKVCENVGMKYMGGAIDYIDSISPVDNEELERILEKAEKGPKKPKDEVAVDSKPEETDEPADKGIDYNSMKVAELKELLKERELPVSGTKAELIERLQT